MTAVFWASAAIAILATLAVIVQLNAVHALLYLIVSLLSVALMFYTLGAPLAAALEVIIYAGAIMVLFVFVVMILNLGPQATAQERSWLSRWMWIGPAVLAALLLAELIYLVTQHTASLSGTVVEPGVVGSTLFGAYLLGVELVSMLLLTSLVGAFHLARREPYERPVDTERAPEPASDQTGQTAEPVAPGASPRAANEHGA